MLYKEGEEVNEAGLERKICEHIRSLGGRAFKFVSPGCPGVPDRLCVLPGGRVVFIEVKRPGRKDGLSVQQKKTIGWLRRMGCVTWVINDYEQFLRRLDEEIL